ncbi:MAG: hypothetical protein H6730_23910 [Deltaproteobacteria bacterium]|nr:hypothetical protein [Deltaproteobacteria bacterium]
MRTTKLLWAIPLLLTSAACEQVDSSAIRTEGIYADFTAVSHGEGQVALRANLRVGGPVSNTYIDLVDGDRLEAQHGLERQEMDRDVGLFGAIDYHARFEDDGDRTYRVAFMRERHDTEEAACLGDSAPDSTVVLPPPFALTVQLPTADDRASRRNDDVVLRWTPSSSDSMRVSLSGRCIRPWALDTNDDGELRIDAGDIEWDRDNDESDACEVEVSVVREREGRVDTAFGEGGRFVGQQVRSARFYSVP